MKLAFIGLEGHVGAVLAGAKSLGDVEVVAVPPPMRPVRGKQSLLQDESHLHR